MRALRSVRFKLSAGLISADDFLAHSSAMRSLFDMIDCAPSERSGQAAALDVVKQMALKARPGRDCLSHGANADAPRHRARGRASACESSEHLHFWRRSPKTRTTPRSRTWRPF